MLLSSSIDQIIVVTYLLLMVGVGFAVSHFSKNAKDFFRGGNVMPWWLAGISLFMTSFSVYTFTGAAYQVYHAPAVAFICYFINSFGFIFGYLVLAKLWRRSRSSTVFSYLGERYSLSTNQVYSWTQMLAVMVQGGVMLLGLGKFISVAMGTDLQMTIAVCGIVVAVYCLIGGLWAVVITDTLQFMVVFPCVLVIMFLGLDAIGGFSALIKDISTWKINTSGVDLAGHPWAFDWSWIAAFGVMMFFAANGGAAAQRYFSVKKESDASKVALMCAICKILALFIWLLPPLCTRILGLDVSFVSSELGMNAPEDAAYVVFCMEYLPVGAMGILLASMLSATMSSLSSHFNIYSAVISEDIIKQMFWKSASSRALLTVGRLVTLVFGLLVTTIAIVMTYYRGGVFALMIHFSGIVILPAGMPIVLGLLYRNTPSWAATASYMVGLLIGIITLFQNEPLIVFGFELLSSPVTFQQRIFVIGPISALVFFLPGLFIKAKGEYKQRLDQFFAKLQTPIEDIELADSTMTDAGSYMITGWTTVVMGVLVSLLAFLDLPFAGRMINLAIGLLMCAFGLLLIWMYQAVKKARITATATES